MLKNTKIYEHQCTEVVKTTAQQILLVNDRLLGLVKKFMTQFYTQVTPVQEAMTHYLVI